MVQYLATFLLAATALSANVQLSLGGGAADMAPISYYGSFAVDGKPGVTFDKRLYGPICRIEVAAGEHLLLRNHFFWGEYSEAKRLGEPGDPELIDNFAIDGSGFGGTLPITQEASSTSRLLDNQLDIMLRANFRCGGGISITPAVGFTMHYASLCETVSLRNYESGFFNGTTSEKISTHQNGARFELECVALLPGGTYALIRPSFALLSSLGELQGTQDFGENGPERFWVDETTNRVSYDLSCSLQYGKRWGKCSLTAEGFGRYRSYMPGVYNPREDDEGGATLTIKNAAQWGVMLSFGYTFL